MFISVDSRDYVEMWNRCDVIVVIVNKIFEDPMSVLSGKPPIFNRALLDVSRDR